MKSYLVSKCDFCGTTLNEDYIDCECPYCGNKMVYKISESMYNDIDSDYKLNSPLEFMFAQQTYKNYNFNRLVNPEKLVILFIYKFVGERKVLFKLCFNWNYKYNESYSIFEDINKINNYYLDKVDLNNLTFSDESLFVDCVEVDMYNGAEEKFKSIIHDNITTLNSFSNYFQIFSSIDFDLDDIEENSKRKTFYEFVSVNYLLHILQMLKINIYEDIDSFLISFENLLNNNYFINNSRILFDGELFIDKVKDLLNYNINIDEDYEFMNDIEDYEDLYYHYNTVKEGCVGAIPPNAVPLSTASQRSVQIFDKLYKLGYNPKMNIYSNNTTSKLIPTFEINNETIYIDCENDLLNGINYFNNMEDLKEALNEIHNPYSNEMALETITINKPYNILDVIKSAKNEDDIIQKILSFHKDENMKNDTFERYKYDVSNTLLSEFRQIPLNSSVINKYISSYYNLRNVRWNDNMNGYLFMDHYNNVAAYVISEKTTLNDNIDPIANDKIVNILIHFEVASQYKNKGIEDELLYLCEREFHIEYFICRNLKLMNYFINNGWKEIITDKGNHYLKKNNLYNINESFILNEDFNVNKRKKIEDLIYKVFNTLDKTGLNTKKYKDKFSKMNNKEFAVYMKQFFNNPKKNFYLEVLPNKNTPRLVDVNKTLKILDVPTEEFVYFKHDGHANNPIRTRYKVPVVYLHLRRLQQILSKKNTYSNTINKRNLKTYQLTADDKIA